MMCVFFTVKLSRCNMAAVHISVHKVQVAPEFLSAKFLCFGFASTNHIARNHIDKTVYGPQRNGRYHTVKGQRFPLNGDCFRK